MNDPQADPHTGAPVEADREAVLDRIDEEAAEQGRIDEAPMTPTEKLAARDDARAALDDALDTGRSSKPASA